MHMGNLDTECKYGDECYAQQRLEVGGNDLKDRCHITIYRHTYGRQAENEEINSFCCVKEQHYGNQQMERKNNQNIIKRTDT